MSKFREFFLRKLIYEFEFEFEFESESEFEIFFFFVLPLAAIGLSFPGIFSTVIVFDTDFCFCIIVIALDGECRDLAIKERKRSREETVLSCNISESLCLSSGVIIEFDLEDSFASRISLLF